MEKLTIQIASGGRIQEPIILEGVTWETVRKGEAGKLTFTCIKDNVLSFSEGSPVQAFLGDKGFFSGYVVEKKRNKDQHIEVTAYDQLWYLKNKSTYIMNGVRADQIVKRISDDFGLKTGSLANTGFVIGNFAKRNQSLFDMILDSIDDTVMHTNNLFYLYDDFGKLTLKNIKDSRTNFLINDATAEDFDYSSSINSETYNRIVLITNSDKNGRGVKTVKDDLKNIKQWGVLQYFEEVDEGVNAKAKAEALLKLYNMVYRNLKINKNLGDIKIRAGSGVFLDLNLGDKDIDKKLFLVEKAVHTFENNHHYMDLTLNGNQEFYGQ